MDRVKKNLTGLSGDCVMVLGEEHVKKVLPPPPPPPPGKNYPIIITFHKEKCLKLKFARAKVIFLNKGVNIKQNVN